MLVFVAPLPRTRSTQGPDATLGQKLRHRRVLDPQGPGQPPSIGGEDLGCSVGVELLEVLVEALGRRLLLDDGTHVRVLARHREIVDDGPDVEPGSADHDR